MINYTLCTIWTHVKKTRNRRPVTIFVKKKDDFRHTNILQKSVLIYYFRSNVNLAAKKTNEKHYSDRSVR